jgi:hypothetical protein
MARLWSCGFELQSVTAGVEMGTVGGTLAIDTTTKRSGLASLRFNPVAGNSSETTVTIGTTVDTVWIRFYINIATLPDVQTEIFYTDDAGGGSTCSILVNTNGTLELWGLTNDLSQFQQKGSDSSALNTDTWYMVEIAVDTSTNTWQYEAKLNGTSFASGTTSAGFTGDTDRFSLGTTGMSNPATFTTTTVTTNIYFDDVAVNDDSGTVQNSYPGAGSIVHLHPNAAGDAAATAGDYTAIDEVTPNDATDYIQIDDNGAANYNFEAYTVPGIGASDTITLVQIGLRHRPETAAASAYTPQIKSQASGTTVGGTSTTHNDTTWKTNGDALPIIYKLTSYVDPQGGGAWTPALLSSMIAGVNVTDAAPDFYISTLWALVEYVPAVVGGTAVKDLIGGFIPFAR